MRLPHPLRFSEGGNLCGLHRAGFLSVCVTLDASRTKSKSQEVESIVSHPLKFAEGAQWRRRPANFLSRPGQRENGNDSSDLGRSCRSYFGGVRHVYRGAASFHSTNRVL